MTRWLLLISLACFLLCVGLAEAAITVTPSPLTYTGQVGTGTLTQAVVIKNTGTASVTFAWANDVAWMQGPVATLAAGVSQTFQIQATTTGLAAGVYNGIAKLWASGVAQATVPLKMTLTTTAPVVPSVPGNVKVVSVPSPPVQVTTATLLWNANTEPDVAGYKVYRSTTSGTYGAVLATLGKVTTYTATGLTPGTTYFFTVTAYDTAGNESVKSNQVSKLMP